MATPARDHEVAVQPGTSGVGAAISEALGGGRCVLLTGPAGIGRSRALRDAAGRLDLADGRALRATASVAAVPFGALLPLLGEGRPASRTGTAIDLLMALRGADRAPVLVDDAHLLDAASAGVLHQAAASGVPVAVAVRDGAPVPDAIGRLVPDLDAIEIRVRPLGEDETAAVLVRVLGGSVDEGFVRVVQQRSGGVPLAVQTLARVALASGAVEKAGAEWWLRGPIPVSDEVGALMRGSTAALSVEGRRAAELVALAERLTEVQLVRAGARRGAEDAERAGVLDVASDGAATLAHPLLLDALIAALPVLRRRRRLSQLLEATEGDDTGPARLRRARWMVELGATVGPGELLELVDVTAVDDPGSAERFARAAVAGGGGVAARLRLAELLAHLHRADDADAVLSEVDARSVDPAAQVDVELRRAFLLAFALARPGDALAVLAALRDVPMVRALRAAAHLHDGRVRLAAEAAAAVADDPGLPIDARAHAALTLAGALAVAQDHDAFVASLPALRHLVDAAAIPEGRQSVRLLEVHEALASLADPAEVRRIAADGSVSALARGAEGERAQWRHHRGAAALLAGDPAAALRDLRAAARSRAPWAITMEGRVRSALVRALVLAGEQAEAVDELERLRAATVPPGMRGDVRLAAAEVAAGALDLERAGRIAATVAGEDPAGGADAWYVAMRFGAGGAGAAFLAASERLGGPGRAAQRRHAQAMARRDVAALEDAAAALEEAGLGWYAVEAMAHAVRLAASLDPGDAAPRERLRRLAAGHPSLRSPVVAALDRPVLTEREAEVAGLVAGGASARAVAAALGVGVRTVETHVAHAYRKLGVSTRDELRRLLALR